MIGVHEREQRATQPVVFGVRLFASIEGAGESGALAATLDYSAIADQLRMLSEHGRFLLIESLAVAAARLLLAPPLPEERRPAVEAVELRIRKPDALGGIGVPGVHLFRSAGRPTSSFEVAPGVWADILVDLPQGGAWRVRMAPGSRWSVGRDLAGLVQFGAIDAGTGRTLGPGDRLARGGCELMALGAASVLSVGHWA